MRVESAMNSLGILEVQGLVASIEGLDAMLKAAQVRVCAFYGPPSPTNFGGALLTGSQSDCQAACDAFARAVIDVAANPIETLSDGASS